MVAYHDVEDYLSKSAALGCLCAFAPFLLIAMGVLSVFNTGNSTTSCQLLAGSIIVAHIKSSLCSTFVFKDMSQLGHA